MDHFGQYLTIAIGLKYCKLSQGKYFKHCKRTMYQERREGGRKRGGEGVEREREREGSGEGDRGREREGEIFKFLN